MVLGTRAGHCGISKNDEVESVSTVGSSVTGPSGTGRLEREAEVSVGAVSEEYVGDGA
jgi:hypothetical protein